MGRKKMTPVIRASSRRSIINSKKWWSFHGKMAVATVAVLIWSQYKWMGVLIQIKSAASNAAFRHRCRNAHHLNGINVLFNQTN
jgi:hypothetical protein